MAERNRKTVRNKEIYIDWLSGLYLKTIAEKHKISITRVRQIVAALEDDIDLVDTEIIYQGKYPQRCYYYLLEKGYFVRTLKHKETGHIVYRVYARDITQEFQHLLKCLPLGSR